METFYFLAGCLLLLILIGLVILVLIKKAPKQEETVPDEESEYNFNIPELLEHITSQSDKAQATFLYMLVGELSKSHVESLNKYCNGRLKTNRVSAHRRTSTTGIKDATLSTFDSGSKHEADSQEAQKD